MTGLIEKGVNTSTLAALRIGDQIISQVRTQDLPFESETQHWTTKSAKKIVDTVHDNKLDFAKNNTYQLYDLTGSNFVKNHVAQPDAAIHYGAVSCHDMAAVAFREAYNTYPNYCKVHMMYDCEMVHWFVRVDIRGGATIIIDPWPIYAQSLLSSDHRNQLKTSKVWGSRMGEYENGQNYQHSETISTQQNDIVPLEKPVIVCDKGKTNTKTYDHRWSSDHGKALVAYYDKTIAKPTRTENAERVLDHIAPMISIRAWEELLIATEL